MKAHPEVTTISTSAKLGLLGSLYFAQSNT